jgi:hypothetical protein
LDGAFNGLPNFWPFAAFKVDSPPTMPGVLDLNLETVIAGICA